MALKERKTVLAWRQNQVIKRCPAEGPQREGVHAKATISIGKT